MPFHDFHEALVDVASLGLKRVALSPKCFILKESKAVNCKMICRVLGNSKSTRLSALSYSRIPVL